MTAETISLAGVPAASLRLMGEDVLVRPVAAEERTASGLFVPNTPAQNWTGGVFYGTVVAVGPGRLVERGPSPEAIRDFISGLQDRWWDAYHDAPQGLARDVAEFVRSKTTHERAPLPWKVGDLVACRQGFGPEVTLREGRHYIVGRGNADHGHGVIAAWEPGHAHCWHVEGPAQAEAFCRCGEHRHIETRLPACSECPPGERLAEAVLGGKVVDVKIPDAPPPGEYELRPEDDGREDV